MEKKKFHERMFALENWGTGGIGLAVALISFSFDKNYPIPLWVFLILFVFGWFITTRSLYVAWKLHVSTDSIIKEHETVRSEMFPRIRRCFCRDSSLFLSSSYSPIFKMGMPVSILSSSEETGGSLVKDYAGEIYDIDIKSKTMTIKINPPDKYFVGWESKIPQIKEKINDNIRTLEYIIQYRYDGE